MELLLIWYNPKKDMFHYKIVHNYYSNNYSIGDKNSYNHELVNIFAICDRFYCIKNNRLFLKKYYSKKSIRSKIIDRLIDYLIGIKGDY